MLKFKNIQNMKKSLVLFAAAAAMVACSQNDVLVDNISESQAETAIGFGTGINNLTRGTTAENSNGADGEALNSYHTTFGVWGYKQVGTGDEQAVFNNQTCTWTTTSVSDPFTTTGDWVYSPIRYWDKTATYDFYAYAPSTKEFTIDGSKDAHYLKLSSFTVVGKSLAQSTTVIAQPDDIFGADNASNEDLMIATDVKDYVYTQGLRVSLDFNHILSRLNIAVKTTIPEAVAADATAGTPASGATVTINKILVYNMENSGSFDESQVSGTDLSNGTTGRWTLSGTKNTTGIGVSFDADGKGTPSEYVKTATDYYPSAAKSNVVTATAKFFYQGLVMPQPVKYEPLALDGSDVSSASEPYLYIDYTITYASGEVETNKAWYNLAQVFNVSIQVRNSLGYPAYETTVGGTYAYFFADNWYNEDGTAFTGELKYDSEHNVIPVYTAGNEKDQISFCEGWQNNLTINISPLAILFDASVFKWADKYTQNVDIY